MLNPRWYRSRKIVMLEKLDDTTPAPVPPLVPGHLRAATFLHANHGQDALSEAVRHGMFAQQRDDEPATAFWCAVCSLLVHMRQVGNFDLTQGEEFLRRRPQENVP